MLSILLASLLTVAAQAAALPRAVIYLPQTELLCGGAAAAMVMRYWGDAGARPEDFSPLVDAQQGGILTTALVDDLRRRGWQAFPLRGDDGFSAVTQHLARGRPIVALIEDRPSRYHYVVVTAVTGAAITFHDPAIAPSQTLAKAEFARRWQGANYWMLLMLPGTGRVEPLATVEPSEPALAVDVARLLRAGDTAQALAAATAATRATPDDPTAWDALATSLFVLDRDRDALDAWNRLGKPAIDTVQIAGLSRTRYRAAEALLDLEPGALLTARSLGRARRRLALLPSAATSRVGYVPLADGRVQIDAAIVERSRMPGAMDLAATAAKAPFSRDIALAFTNLAGAGERVSGSWRFRDGFERVEAAIEVPAPLPIGAVWKLSGDDSRETYSVRGTLISRRWHRAGLQAADWVTPSLGWVAAAGYERWPVPVIDAPHHKTYVAARALIAAGSLLDAHVTLEGWTGGARALRGSALARLAWDAGGGHVSLTAGTAILHGANPAFIQPGAGAGDVRTPLLRAHPLIQDDTINVDNGQLIGRRLLHGTAEFTRPIARIWIAVIDAAAFVDAARAWQLIDGRPSRHQIDAGAGLRFRALGAGPTLRLDLAHGILDGRWAFTAGTSVAFEKWIF